MPWSQALIPLIWDRVGAASRQTGWASNLRVFADSGGDVCSKSRLFLLLLWPWREAFSFSTLSCAYIDISLWKPQTEGQREREKKGEIEEERAAMRWSEHYRKWGNHASDERARWGGLILRFHAEDEGGNTVELAAGKERERGDERQRRHEDLTVGGALRGTDRNPPGSEPAPPNNGSIEVLISVVRWEMRKRLPLFFIQTWAEGTPHSARLYISNVHHGQLTNHLLLYNKLPPYSAAPAAVRKRSSRAETLRLSSRGPECRRTRPPSLYYTKFGRISEDLGKPLHPSLSQNVDRAIRCNWWGQIWG